MNFPGIKKCKLGFQYFLLQEQDARILMEQSRAIKCPTAALQLAGCKKVQQELAAPGVLERFIKDPDVCHRIRATFAGQYSLDLVSALMKLVFVIRVCAMSEL